MKYDYPINDIDAEEAVLGSIMLGSSVLERSCPKCGEPFSDGPRIEEIRLKPTDFHREKNGWIYQVCLGLHKAGKPCNPILVAHELARAHRLEATGGIAYLGHLIAEVPASLHIKYYAEIVKDFSERRHLIERGQQLKERGSDLTRPLPPKLKKSFDV